LTSSYFLFQVHSPTSVTIGSDEAVAALTVSDTSEQLSAEINLWWVESP